MLLNHRAASQHRPAPKPSAPVSCRGKTSFAASLWGAPGSDPMCPPAPAHTDPELAHALGTPVAAPPHPASRVFRPPHPALVSRCCCSESHTHSGLKSTAVLRHGPLRVRSTDQSPWAGTEAAPPSQRLQGTPCFSPPPAAGGTCVLGSRLSSILPVPGPLAPGPDSVLTAHLASCLPLCLVGTLWGRQATQTIRAFPHLKTRTCPCVQGPPRHTK